MMISPMRFLATLIAIIALAVGIGLAGFAKPGFADRGGEPNSHSGGSSGHDQSAGGGASSSGGGGGAVGEFFSSFGPGTLGPTIAGDWYGNTSNPRPDGHGVLPSLSPGPWVCDGADCSAQPTAAGGSMGEWFAPFASHDTAEPDFANGKNPGPDFSEPNKP